MGETVDLADWTERAGALMNAARAGDQAALGQLMDLYRNYLLAVAGAELETGLRPKAGPSDVVQETFVEAMALFPRFEGARAEEFRAWLRAILVNKLAEVRKHYFGVQKRQVQRERSMSALGGDSDDPTPDDLPTSGTSPSNRAARAETDEIVSQVLERLSEDHRNVLVWRQWDGLTFPEIGRRMNRSEDAVRMLFGRALERFAEELKLDPAGHSIERS